ncbi:MAG: nucleotidyl transferase AbiEii/AbiGii toxin family protein [Bryobacterales bacterium]|nr:nucleotidyl transferase AbiEii/AbiGii toxin family protein [Bryobacterales bacterium]
MIDRREIRDSANTFGLRPQVVEKDYVLGWVLAGTYQHTALRDTWIFKGGTCLKKCYFETYRFSEDLDFTVTDTSLINQEFLGAVFGEIGHWVYERTGIEIPQVLQNFDLFENPRGSVSCQGKLSYRGPIAPHSGGLPRIKLDLTLDELLVLPSVERVIFHDYSDAPAEGIMVRCYAYEEAFAEKARALGDRARPRDLYDVINLFRNTDARPNSAVMHDVLRRKCGHRHLAVPTLAELEKHKGDLEGSWQPMLGHQLQALPPVESYWNALPEFFAWLETGVPPSMPTSYRMTAGETVLREPTLRLAVPATARSHLEIIRFSGVNRLCVDLQYQGSVRRIEPYSLRRTQDGNIVLHAIRASDGKHRSYRIDRIEGVQTTGQSYVPRYAVELSPQGRVAIVPSATQSGSVARPRQPRRSTPSRPSRAGWSTGLRYIYECACCGKRFTRKTMTSQLNPHMDKSGFQCPGRAAIYVDTRH